jgi:hypothetical protein
MAEDLVVDLPSFVVITERLLEKILEQRDTFLPADLRDPAVKAWLEFRRVDHQLVDEARDLPGVILQEVGLTGAQWEFKMATYNHVLAAFRKDANLDWLRRLLRISDDLLGSLVQVLTIAEPLKVMKENLEIAIEIVGAENGSFELPAGFMI